MEFFQRAKVFRLKSSHQGKYLIADQDEETVRLTRDNSSKHVRWSFELVEGKSNVIRLRSCLSWKYLAVSEEYFLLGMTGKRVAQRPWLGPTVEWEPIREGPYIKLKTHTGTFLRANRGPPPWRNTITHDLPGHWTTSESMILWIVDLVEIDHKSTNDDPKSTEEVKRIGVPSLSSNVLNQNSLSSNSSLSTEDDGFVMNANSSLESLLPSLDDKLLPGVEEGATSNRKRVHSSEVKMVKQPLKELKDMDFHTILSSGRYKEIEEAANMLVADAKTSRQKRISSDFAKVHEQLKAMKHNYDSAKLHLAEYATFAKSKVEIKADIDKDVAKACVLEGTLEKWFSGEFAHSRVMREELLKHLEETENSIKAVEVLLSRIERKRERLEEMEAKEESWQSKKVEAQLKLDRVEKDWVKIKNLFEDAYS